jgi:hypothetical protein
MRAKFKNKKVETGNRVKKQETGCRRQDVRSQDVGVRM